MQPTEASCDREETWSVITNGKRRPHLSNQTSKCARAACAPPQKQRCRHTAASGAAVASRASRRVFGSASVSASASVRDLRHIIGYYLPPGSLLLSITAVARAELSLLTLGGHHNSRDISPSTVGISSAPPAMQERGILLCGGGAPAVPSQPGRRKLGAVRNEPRRLSPELAVRKRARAKQDAVHLRRRRETVILLHPPLDL